MPSVLLLVRHAESMVPGPGLEDEYTRPLSPRGLDQAAELADVLHRLAPTFLASSPYLRARQTLEPFARLVGLPIDIEPEFREHRMSDVPIDNWREVLLRQWNDFDFAPPQGESFRSSMHRGLGVVERLAERPGVTALAGHGTTISLVLHSIDPSFHFEQHLAMPNPAIYGLERHAGKLRLARF